MRIVRVRVVSSARVGLFGLTHADYRNMQGLGLPEEWIMGLQISHRTDPHNPRNPNSPHNPERTRVDEIGVGH